MLNFFIIFFGKLLINFSQKLNLGNGSTWPGHIALKLKKNFIEDILKKSETKTIIIAGTNGKTTTGKLLSSILSKDQKKVIHNAAGANLINGLASTIISGTKLSGKLDLDYLIFETDENAFTQVIKQTSPKIVVCLNLFRDQLDRYGEIDSIAKKWKIALDTLPKTTTIILNADDPQVSFLGNNLSATTKYFGMDSGEQEKIEHGADSIYCPKCNNNLSYNSISFSHLGDWYCKNCGLKRPKIDLLSIDKYPLLGTYSKYDVLASVLVAKQLGISQKTIDETFKNFKPAFGRQEEIKIGEKTIRLFLSKNPTSFNESLKTILDLKAEDVLIVLNDRIPDGLDVSWIWDINTTPLLKIKNITISGDRVFDMALRLRYENVEFDYESDLKKALKKAFDETKISKTLYILPTYSAMLNTRKILGGRKIL